VSDITINAASYVSANTQADSAQGTQATTTSQSITETAAPEADGVKLSAAAQAKLMLDQGMSVTQIALNLGISVQAVSDALDLSATSIDTPVALPQAISPNQ
jgi:DNA-binding NarL/FixJ family response regulator